MRRMNWVPATAVAIIVLVALVVPFLGLPDPVQIDVSQRLAPPSPSHPLGQDEYGRDVLSRLLWGAQVSLAVAFAAAALACLIGTALGLAGGFLRGLAEVLAIRSMDVVLCFPPLLLALAHILVAHQFLFGTNPFQGVEPMLVVAISQIRITALLLIEGSGPTKISSFDPHRGRLSGGCMSRGSEDRPKQKLTNEALVELRDDQVNTEEYEQSGEAK